MAKHDARPWGAKFDHVIDDESYPCVRRLSNKRRMGKIGRDRVELFRSSVRALIGRSRSWLYPAHLSAKCLAPRCKGTTNQQHGRAVTKIVCQKNFQRSSWRGGCLRLRCSTKEKSTWKQELRKEFSAELLSIRLLKISRSATLHVQKHNTRRTEI